VESKKPDPVNDRELVGQVIRGSKESFRVLIKQHQRLVLSIVDKMIPDRDDKKDISQDVFIKVYTHLDGFKFESSLSTWIGRIAYTTCLNFLKKKKEIYLDSLQSTSSKDNEDVRSVPEPTDFHYMDNVLQADLKEKLGAEIYRLPVIIRTIITLYHLDGLSYNEVCDIVQLPLGTVKSHLFRGRILLKQSILKHYKKGDLL
jgi:RNA polymerase sigma factor (sigma-70 family)